MQAFLKVKKNIAGRNEKKPLESNKSANSPIVQNLKSKIVKLPTPNKSDNTENIALEPINYDKESDTKIKQIAIEKILPKIREITAMIETDDSNSLDLKVEVEQTIAQDSTEVKSEPIPIEDVGFESDGSDKENVPEYATKRKASTPVPFLITPTQKKFKTVIGKSPAFTQFSSQVSQLELPDTFRKLIILFNQFDNTLVYLKQKNQICVFHNVQRIVEVNANRGFTVEDFRKILTIEPEMYSLRPYHIVNQDVDTFTIDFKETESIFDLFKLIPSRRLEFEKKLVDKVKVCHQVLKLIAILE